MVLRGFVRFCVVLHGFTLFTCFCMVLNDLCDSHDVRFLQYCVVLKGYLNMIHMFKNHSF